MGLSSIRAVTGGLHSSSLLDKVRAFWSFFSSNLIRFSSLIKLLDDLDGNNALLN